MEVDQERNKLRGEELRDGTQRILTVLMMANRISFGISYACLSFMHPTKCFHPCC